MSPFYEETFKAWCVINSITKQNHNTQCGILNGVIWYNSNITQAGKPLFLKELEHLQLHICFVALATFDGLTHF